MKGSPKLWAWKSGQAKWNTRSGGVLEVHSYWVPHYGHVTQQTT